MERLKERLAIAQQPLNTLEELVNLAPPSPVERDAAIQRFEYTFAASVRAAQRYLLVVEGLNAGSPKAAIRAAREVGLLTDDQAITGLEMVDDRNLTVHTYNEALARRIYGNLRRYAGLLKHCSTPWQSGSRTRGTDLPIIWPASSKP